MNLLTEQSLTGIIQCTPAERTKTYSPIANLEIISKLQQIIDANDFEVSSVDVVKGSSNHQRCIVNVGLIDKLDTSPDPEIGIRVAFRNSYDRSMSFGFAIGSEVFICSNGMVSGEYTARKVHRGKNIEQYIDATLEEAFMKIRESHKANIEFAQALKDKAVNEMVCHEIIGDLFIQKRILTREQLHKMAIECYKSTKFDSFSKNNIISAWSVYNAGTEALKQGVSRDYFKKHIEYNNFFRRKFNITQKENEVIC